MEQITLDKLSGNTIARAAIVNNTLVIVFDDDKYFLLGTYYIDYDYA